MAGEIYRGRVMYRVTRPDRQAYIARALLANGKFVEAIFDTDDYIDVGGGQTCHINQTGVQIATKHYAVTSYAILDRGQTITEPPPATIVGEMHLRAHQYGLTASFTLETNGLWLLTVHTPRGEIEVPVIPGDHWPTVLELAGLGATVCA